MIQTPTVRHRLISDGQKRGQERDARQQSSVQEDRLQEQAEDKDLPAIEQPAGEVRHTPLPQKSDEENGDEKEEKNGDDFSGRRIPTQKQVGGLFEYLLKAGVVYPSRVGQLVFHSVNPHPSHG